MRTILPHSIEYDHARDDNLSYEIPVLAWSDDQDIQVYDVADFWRDQVGASSYTSFDDWLRLLDREQENRWIESLIAGAAADTRRHIRNVSTTEAVLLIRDMYEDCGYFSDYPRACQIPFASAPITVSISIEHLLYSSKDKNHISDIARYPALRSPSDQRVILTGLRTGVIAGIEVGVGQEGLVRDLLVSEILSPFEIGRLCAYNFQDRGIGGTMKTCLVRGGLDIDL